MPGPRRVVPNRSIRLLASMVLVSSPVALAQQLELYGSDGVLLPFASSKQVEEFLDNARIMQTEKIEAGTNKKKRRLLLEREGLSVRAIHRSVFEHRDGPDGGFVDSYKSEIAAYRLASLLGLDNVPPVVRRKGGSLQIWIEKATSKTERMKAGAASPYSPAYTRQIKDMDVFDNLIANIDRNTGNVLLDSHGKVWFIDHTRSFSGNKELKYPDKIRGCSRIFWHRLRGVSDEQIRKAVGPYVRNLEELLLRRALLVEVIERSIAELGEDVFLYDRPSDF